MGTPESDRQHDATLQRVRVGVTGLAAVFLLTLLAASILALLGQDSRSPASPSAPANLASAEAPREPLAELGVAPGNGPKAAAAPTPAARPPALPRKP